jgi:hypothetical protein
VVLNSLRHNRIRFTWVARRAARPEDVANCGACGNLPVVTNLAVNRCTSFPSSLPSHPSPRAGRVCHPRTKVAPTAATSPGWASLVTSAKVEFGLAVLSYWHTASSCQSNERSVPSAVRDTCPDRQRGYRPGAPRGRWSPASVGRHCAESDHGTIDGVTAGALLRVDGYVDGNLVASRWVGL